jgi:hypothetical protein
VKTTCICVDERGQICGQPVYDDTAGPVCGAHWGELTLALMRLERERQSLELRQSVGGGRG